VDIMYGEGISKEGEIVDIGSEMDILQKSGSWYSYNNERVGQGRENAKQFLKENPDIRHKIEMQIRESYGLEGEIKAPEDNDVAQDELDLLD
jgi:recombination protein RecA